MAERIGVFVAWPYANGPLHLGHVAGAYLPPDIFARYHRLRGNEVLMVSGSDTHGTPITVRAEQEGLQPWDVVERYHTGFLDSFIKLGISFDLFTHTDTENHYAVAQNMFLRLLEKGYIYREVMQALYCEHCDRFLPDRYVEGICPFCGFENARGDQCDKCGKLINAIELIEPRCKFCGHKPVVSDTEHFFLDLTKFSERLSDWLRDKDYWRPNVLNFTLNLLEEGLRGRPITRDIEWGIPVPLEGYGDKRIYVWFEAVIGYLSATIEWAKNRNQPDRWRDWWQKPAKAYYFIGKDNIPFHAIIWPAMLMGYGGLNLPYNVPANEYLTLEGQKFSTSRNWAVWLPDYLERYDPDPLRYILSINMPETSDTDFNWREFLRRNNDELVATYGNLVHRTLTFAYRRFEGMVPTPGELDDTDRALLTRVEDSFAPIGDLIERCRFKSTIAEIMSLAHEGNRYLEEKSPWFQIKEDKKACATTIYVALRVIDSLKILFYPFLPFSSQKLQEYLGYDGDLIGRLEIKTFQEEGKIHQALCYKGDLSQVGWSPSNLPAGQRLRKPKPLFRKLDEGIVEEEMGHLRGGST